MNGLWGKHDEVHLKMKTYQASRVKVIAACGKMDYVGIIIPVSLFYRSERYIRLCEEIADDMNIGIKNFQVMDYNGYACIITGIYLSTFDIQNKRDVQEIIEEMAEYVIKFRRKLDDFGYTDQDTEY